MAIFKEVVRGDGSGIAEYYRVQDGKVMNVDYSMVTNKPTINGVVLAGDLTLTDFGAEGVVETMTGEEIAQLGENTNTVVLCTSDYLYTDRHGVLTQTERGTVYEIAYGTIVDTISVSGSGSGGGGGGIPRSNFSVAESELEQKVSVNASVSLKYKFVTTARPNTGTAKLYVNNVLKSTKSVVSGNSYEFNVSPYLKAGINYFTIKTSDSNGAEKNFDFIVDAIQLTISSAFNTDTFVNQTFDFRYRIYGAGEKTIHFILDDVETTETTGLTNAELTKQFQSLSHGEHTLKVYATVTLDDGELSSNELYYHFISVDPASSQTLIMSEFNTTECTEGDLLSIDYLIYNPSALVADAQLMINDEVQLNIKADRTKHVWNVSNYPVGTTKFSIKCGDVQVDKVVEVAELDIDIKDVTDNLQLYLTAANRSNQEGEDTISVWKYGDIEVELTGFNWISNGWIDNKLKFSGDARGYIPLNIFEEDVRALGKTIEIEFETHQALNINSILATCMAEDKGFEITINKCLFKSEQTEVEAKFNESNKVRISFVIESLSSSSRLVKTYLNGVLSGLKQYATTDNFQQNNPVGITINPDGEEFDISCIRVYTRALSSQEIVSNYIYDLNDNALKIKKYTDNLVYDDYGNISYLKVKAQIPVLTITGPMPTYKGDKQTVHCLYEDIKNDSFNFEYDECTIDVQGTSSQYYPRKNWKIKFPEEFAFYDGAIPEKEYTFKADFMESSHSHNVGTAILANSLYTSFFPTKTADNGVRDTIYGFPCAIFHKEDENSAIEFYGTYMFNNDKGNNKTLGLTTDKSESWEYKNNTSDLCLFKTDDFTADDVADNLEARYPDKYTDYTAISQMYSWVVSCKDNVEKFKEEFEQHFNLHYCLVYRVLMELAMLVDSRAKNMFMDTVDGEIWYPRFYDMDTCWGLNNEGELKWDYDVEIFDKIGTAYVWNDRGESVFWNLFEEAYETEISEMYHTLRDDKLTYDNIVRIYIEDISSVFNESEYNEDAQFKYVDPLTNENNSTYLYAAQGSRADHFRYILAKRLDYLDSKYNYGTYNTNYATMRLYTKEGDFTLTTYNTAYMRVKFGSTIVMQKIQANSPTIIPAPKGLEFNDTETIIYGADKIMDFGDLSNKYAGTIDISRCPLLLELNAGNDSIVNENLISLSLGNNPMLRKINLRNCSKLSGDFDVSAAANLEEIDLRGTSVTAVTLPENGTLRKIYFPDTLSTLILKNQKNLEVLELNNPGNVQTLILEATNWDIQELMSICSSVKRLRVHFDKNYISSMPYDQFSYYVNNLKGVDSNGLNTDYPSFTGEIKLLCPDYLTEDELEEAKEKFQNIYGNGLKIEYETVESMIAFSGYKIIEDDAAKYHHGDFTRVEFETGVSTVQAAKYTSVEDEIEFYCVGKNKNNLPKGNIFLPEKYKGKPVLGIGDPSSPNYVKSAFSGCSELITITIPESYKLFSMGGHGFYFPDNGTNYQFSISGNAFQGCTNLKRINATYGPDSNFGYDCFSGCTSLEYLGDTKNIVSVGNIGWTTTMPLKRINFPNLRQNSYEFGKQDTTSKRGNLQEAIINFQELRGSSHCFSRVNCDVDLLNFNSNYFVLVYTDIYNGVEREWGVTYNLTKELITICSSVNKLNLRNKAFSYFPCKGVVGSIEGLDGTTVLKSNLMIGCFNEDIITFNELTEVAAGYENYYGWLHGKTGSRKAAIIGSSYDVHENRYSSNLSFPKLNTISIAGGAESKYLFEEVNNLYLNGEILKIKFTTNGASHTATDTRYYIYAYKDVKKFHNFYRAIDASEINVGFYIGNVSTNGEKLFNNITHFEGAIDYGKGFTFTTVSASSIKLDVSEFISLPHEDYVTILENLYDISGFMTNPQAIVLPKVSQSMLTEEEIAIATNKGWNVLFK